MIVSCWLNFPDLVAIDVVTVKVERLSGSLCLWSGEESVRMNVYRRERWGAIWQRRCCRACPG
jgi:hypothetical protein